MFKAIGYATGIKPKKEIRAGQKKMKVVTGDSAN